MIQENVFGTVWFREKCGAISSGRVMGANQRAIDPLPEDVAIQVKQRIVIRPRSDVFRTEVDAIYAELKESSERLQALQMHVARLTRRMRQLAEVQDAPLPSEVTTEGEG